MIESATTHEEPTMTHHDDHSDEARRAVEATRTERAMAARTNHRGDLMVNSSAPWIITYLDPRGRKHSVGFSTKAARSVFEMALYDNDQLDTVLSYTNPQS